MQSHGERNFDVPPDRRILLRIGVNLGDIIHERTRAYGDSIIECELLVGT